MRNNETLSYNASQEEKADEGLNEAEKEERKSFLRGIGGKILRLFNKEKPVKNVNKEVYLLSERMQYSEFAKDVYEFWDNIGVEMPAELGEMVERYITEKDRHGNPKWCFGVHRSSKVNGRHYDTDVTLKHIMKDGLMNMGDDSSGYIYKDPPVSKTVTICSNMLNATLNMKSSYKDSTGAVLVAVPNEYLKEEGEVKKGMENNVYNHNKDGFSYLKPEYILGFVQNLGEGSRLEFKSREELLKGYNDHGQQGNIK